MKQFFLVFDHPILQDRMTQTIKKDQHRIQQKSDHKTNYNRCCRPVYRIQYLPKACPLLQYLIKYKRCCNYQKYDRSRLKQPSFSFISQFCLITFPFPHPKPNIGYVVSFHSCNNTSMDLFLHIIINNLKKLYTVSKSQAIEFPIFNRF